MPPSTNLRVVQWNQVIRFWNVSSELPLNNLTHETQWYFQEGSVKIIIIKKIEQKMFREFTYGKCAQEHRDKCISPKFSLHDNF